MTAAPELRAAVPAVSLITHCRRSADTKSSLNAVHTLVIGPPVIDRVDAAWRCVVIARGLENAARLDELIKRVK